MLMFGLFYFICIVLGLNKMQNMYLEKNNN